MTPADLARLTEEERAIVERPIRWFHTHEADVRFLAIRLAQARAVVEAAREVEAAFTRRPRAAPLRPVIEKLIAAVRSHDAEAGKG